MQDEFDTYLEHLRRDLEQELGLTAAEPSLPPVPHGIAFMITKAQREALRARGYSDEQIRQMRPEQARQILDPAS